MKRRAKDDIYGDDIYMDHRGEPNGYEYLIKWKVFGVEERNLGTAIQFQ